jgi:hypothetical protein
VTAPEKPDALDQLEADLLRRAREIGDIFETDVRAAVAVVRAAIAAGHPAKPGKTRAPEPTGPDPVPVGAGT